jgi:hypothetical protein
MDGVDLNANFKFVLRQINKLRIVASLDRTVVISKIYLLVSIAMHLCGLYWKWAAHSHELKQSMTEHNRHNPVPAAMQYGTLEQIDLAAVMITTSSL